MAITDHDSLIAQEKAIALTKEYGIGYITGVELNVTFPFQNKDVSLDFLGYNFDIHNQPLLDKLRVMRERREQRAQEILDKINAEFKKEGRDTVYGTGYAEYPRQRRRRFWTAAHRRIHD